MKPGISVLLLTSMVVLTSCATSTPYGHGDVVVGKKAIFRHKGNGMAKLDCTECHDKLYINVQQHKKKDMEVIFTSSESCGTCHNGTRAFSVHGNCDRCHRKNA